MLLLALLSQYLLYNRKHTQVVAIQMFLLDVLGVKLLSQYDNVWFYKKRARVENFKVNIQSNFLVYIFSRKRMNRKKTFSFFTPVACIVK